MASAPVLVAALGSMLVLTPVSASEAVAEALSAPWEEPWARTGGGGEDEAGEAPLVGPAEDGPGALALRVLPWLVLSPPVLPLLLLAPRAEEEREGDVSLVVVAEGAAPSTVEEAERSGTCVAWLRGEKGAASTVEGSRGVDNKRTAGAPPGPPPDTGARCSRDMRAWQQKTRHAGKEGPTGEKDGAPVQQA